MGRPSRASLTVIQGRIDQRPDPPAELTEAQAAIWRATVASESADFFRTEALRCLLKDYCCHRALADELTAEINKIPAKAALHQEYAKKYANLVGIRGDETRNAADKATKLRLTNQSRYTPLSAATAAKHASTEAKPWEFE